MPKAVSANEAKQRLGALMGWAVEHKDEVIVESHGKPKAVIMAYSEYEAVQRLREQARRREALERLRQVKARVSARNLDLTEEQAQALAEEISRAALDNLVEKGRVRFERDTHQ